MFGPDSSKNGFSGLPIILDKFRTDAKNYIFWKDFFKKKGLKIVEMTVSATRSISSEFSGSDSFYWQVIRKV